MGSPHFACTLSSQVLIETTGCGQNRGQWAVGEGVPTQGEGQVSLGLGCRGPMLSALLVHAVGHTVAGLLGWGLRVGQGFAHMFIELSSR